MSAIAKEEVNIYQLVEVILFADEVVVPPVVGEILLVMGVEVGQVIGQVTGRGEVHGIDVGMVRYKSVSYTHLTLPTIYSV